METPKRPWPPQRVLGVMNTSLNNMDIKISRYWRQRWSKIFCHLTVWLLLLYTVMAISFSTFACNTTCLKYDPTQRPSFHFHILLCFHDLQLQQHKRVDFYITFSRCFNVSLSWLSLVLPIATTKSKKASSPAFCPGEPSFEIKM